MDKTCILIVDDNPEIREIINVLLGGEGFEVSEAENGSQALTLIEQQDFDLIILDIMMPGPNGYQTCRKIRELSNAPILFLSARTKAIRHLAFPAVVMIIWQNHFPTTN